MSASGLGACPFSLQIHLPAHAHPTQCPQRQTLVDHLKGSLGPLLQAQGAQGDMGKKKGVRSESWCQGLPLVGSQIFLHSSGLLLPMAAPPPPHQPQLSLPWKLHCPCGFPRAHLYFAKSLSLDLPQITLI